MTKKLLTLLLTGSCLSISAVAANIQISTANFPDAQFREYLIAQSYGQDGVLTDEEINGITKLAISDKGIANLKGIELFTALKDLDCSKNKLTALDVSTNTKLTQLHCNGNQLPALNVTKNTALQGLWCGSNQLTTLDVSKNTALTKLYCNNNHLTKVDVSSNKALTTMNCAQNPITALDLSKNPKLTGLSINRSNIKGANMDALISSLPTNTSATARQLWVINNSLDDEGNECTKAQVAALKAKGWTALIYSKAGKDWVEYVGSGKQLKYLVVWTKDGTRTTHALKDNTQVKFTDAALVVSKGSQKTTYPMRNMMRFTYESVMPGDVNGDAKVDIVDVAKTINFLLTFTRSDFPEQAADINKSGTVDSDDVTAMIKLVVNGMEADIPASSQQATGDAFYIYRNDGQFNAFFRDEVEKMEYSNYDADGNLHAEVESQVVYTADSVYNIPLTAIDSVGFVTPETVYKQGVIKLEGDVRDYIVSTDSLTIYFRSDTPSSLLPKVGNYLFTEEVSSVFPIGFIGKVETVQPEDGLLAVSCSQVNFEDVFEYYYYVSGKTVEASRRLDEQPQVDERNWERVWSPGTINFPITNLTTPNIYPDPLGDLAFDISNHQNISLTPTFRVKYVRIVTPSRGTEVSLDISEEDVIAEDFSMSGHINWNHDLLTTNDIPFIGLGIPFLWLYGKAGVFLNADATISGEQHFSQTYRYTFHCEGSSRSLLGTRASINGIHLSSEHSGEMMAKGSIELGIYSEIGVAFVDSRIASVAYRGEVGIGVEGNAMLYKKDAEKALHSTDVYKTLKDNDVKFKWFYRTGLPVKLLWFGWPNSHKPHDNVFARVSLVPNFSDTKLERDPEDKTTLFASTKVDGACLPVDLGFTLFEQKSTNSVTTSYSRFGYVGMNADMYASFFNIPTSKKYEVYPTVKLLGIEMLAEPKVEENDETCPDENHPHMIDLGLPSGTKWACCNVGASAPEQFGSLYAWGETRSKSSFSIETYAYAHFTGEYQSFFCKESYETVVEPVYEIEPIGNDISGTIYDAARVNWGAPWCMPNISQVDELYEFCTSERITQKGVEGERLTGSNGGSIFLPYSDGYWISTLSPRLWEAWNLNGFYLQYLGSNVRPVCKY